MLGTCRSVLFLALAVALLITAQPVSCPTGEPCPVCAPPRTLDPLADLAAGNLRFTTSDPKHIHQSVECAKRLKCCQQPFAVIVTCSDSRVPPDVLFDQGIGDLFVVRVAGNVATHDALGSIEYAVDHLGSKLVVLMGHTRCGAVAAAFCPRPGPHLDGIWRLIRPAVAHPFPSCNNHEEPTPEAWDAAVHQNIINMAGIVTHDPKLKPGTTVVQAYYNLDDGKVQFSK
jgi:carbonic anhydrase